MFNQDGLVLPPNVPTWQSEIKETRPLCKACGKDYCICFKSMEEQLADMNESLVKICRILQKYFPE
jgi:hypothetical protein